MKNTKKKKEILYVAYRDEGPEDGLNYAIYLTGLLGTELRVVLLERENEQQQFDDLITAINSGNEDENGDSGDKTSDENENGDAASLHLYLTKKCRDAGVNVNVHSGFMETSKACLDFIGNRKISMVLLSPAVTASEKVLKCLTDSIPQPVVTMSN